MVRISVRVSSGTARFRVAVRAGSIRRALEIAGGGRNPGCLVGMSSPVGPEAFFAGTRAAAGQAELEKAAA